MDGNRIQQIHGYKNELEPCAANPGKVDPRALHREFLTAWLKWLQGGSKRNEDGTPKLPKPKKNQPAAGRRTA